MSSAEYRKRVPQYVIDFADVIVKMNSVKEGDVKYSIGIDLFDKHHYIIFVHGAKFYKYDFDQKHDLSRNFVVSEGRTTYQGRLNTYPRVTIQGSEFRMLGWEKDDEVVCYFDLATHSVSIRKRNKLAV
jgi:hypothetical protein